MEEVDDLILSREIIGEGGFGTVYKAVLDGTTEVAIKYLKEEKRKEACGSADVARQLDLAISREIDILSKFDHPNIVKLIGWAQGSDHRQALVFELCPDGTLYDALAEGSKCVLTVPWLLGVAIGACRGLVHMHGITDDLASAASTSSGVVLHRDVKSLNIGLSGGQAKLLDCGSSRRYNQDPNETFSLYTCTGNALGTQGYIAEEVANCDGYGVCSEIFSFGIVLLEILTGKKAKGLMKTVKKTLIKKDEIVPDFLQIFQSSLLDQRVSWHSEVLEPVLRIALMCIEADADDRPCNMNVVLSVLCQALEKHEQLFPPPPASSAIVNNTVTSSLQLESCDTDSRFRAMQQQIDTMQQTAIEQTKKQAAMQQEMDLMQQMMRGLFDVCITCAHKFPKGLGLKCAEDHAMCPACADVYVSDFLQLQSLKNTSISGSVRGIGDVALTSPLLVCEYNQCSLCAAAPFTDSQVCHGCPHKAAQYMQFMQELRCQVEEEKRRLVEEEREEQLRNELRRVQEEEERQKELLRKAEEERIQEEKLWYHPGLFVSAPILFLGTNVYVFY